MAKLTKTQQDAMDIINRAGVLHIGNGVSIRTVKVLERMGLVTVSGAVRTFTNHRTGRTRHVADWTARPVA